MILSIISDFIKKKLVSKEIKDNHKFPQNQLFQMYFIMSRLDAAKFCQLDFIANFGVMPAVKTKMTELLQTAGSSKEVTDYLETLDHLVLLKLHKYFFWADKKLHHVFYIEDKEHISEDLLIDFKDDDGSKIKESQNLGQ